MIPYFKIENLDMRAQLVQLDWKGLIDSNTTTTTIQTRMLYRGTVFS